MLSMGLSSSWLPAASSSTFCNARNTRNKLSLTSPPPSTGLDRLWTTSSFPTSPAARDSGTSWNCWGRVSGWRRVGHLDDDDDPDPDPDANADAVADADSRPGVSVLIGKVSHIFKCHTNVIYVIIKMSYFDTLCRWCKLNADVRTTSIPSRLQCVYIVVQQTTTVSLTGFPVLRTLYKPMYMHKRIKSQNCEFCVL